MENNYGYKAALEKAGWKVHFFWEENGYSGRWIAHVLLVNKDKVIEGYINDYFGSCSECDPLLNHTDGAKISHELAKEFCERFIDKLISFEELKKDLENVSSTDIDEQKALDALLAYHEGIKE